MLFGHPTLEKLTAYLLDEHSAALAAAYQETVADKEICSTDPSVAEPLATPKIAKARAVVRHTSPALRSEPIAIIGMSGRFPQSRNVEEMWTILAEGREAVGLAPVDREGGWAGTSYRAGFVPGVSEFEPLFFEISPREAEAMDPRQRLLLQEAWAALEDAGYGPQHLRAHRMGMFVGVEDGDYALLSGDADNVTGTNTAILASRLAYVLNFGGPAMALNTACSSGLVAVHQACQSLRAGECDTAVAAGVNLLLRPELYRAMAAAGMLSPDGRCRAFAAGADGMVPAEAIAVVVLKPLSRAEADGDPIDAVIAGSGINYDGRTNGITAPSGSSQAALLKSVYDGYGIDPNSIELVVAHGTGTALGDPIEANALIEAFGSYTAQAGSCALISTKGNFGHSLAASGVVSLIALVQALRHQTMPASLHCEAESDYVRWSESPFTVNRLARAWPRRQTSRRIGAVSAFGISGTNAHVVVREADGVDEPTEVAPCYLLALSAKSEAALLARIAALAVLLEREAAPDLARVSHTLLAGRHHFAHRCAVVVEGHQDALHVLRQAGGKERLPNLFRGTVARQFAPQKALQGYGQTLLAQGRSLRSEARSYREALQAVAELYCQGYSFEWGALYDTTPPRRMSLPTYPFARERYWAPSGTVSTTTAAVLHPLVHRNTSDLSGPRFTTILTGQEFFLADHVVAGQHVLPGVAHLEMARAAVALAADVPAGSGIHLSEVAWLRPLLVEGPLEVRIGLHPEANGTIGYEIYGERDGARVVWSQGVRLWCLGRSTAARRRRST